MLFKRRYAWKGFATLTCPGLRHHDVRVRVTCPRQTGGHRSNSSKHAAIAAQTYPKTTNRESLRKAYVEQMGASTRAQRAPNFDFSSADMSDIQRLRHEGKTWGQITDMKYPGRNWKSVRRAVLQQDNGAGEYRKPCPRKMSSADMADIKRLRQGGKTWDQIRDMKYPGRTSGSLRKDVLRQSSEAGEFRKPALSKMPPAEIADIKRLLLEGKTWEQIRVMKFPAQSAELVRISFLKQEGNRSDRYRPITDKITPAVLEDIKRLRAAKTKWHEIVAMYLPKKHPMTARDFILQRMEKLYGAENRHTWMYPPGPQPFEIPPADHEEIKRLLEAKTSWEEITRLKYPDQKWWSVRRAALRHEIHDLDKRNGRPPALKIGPKENQKIERLREKGGTWQEITETMYPDRNVQNVRMAFMRANKGKEYATRLGRPPRIKKLRSIDVRRIKRLRKSKLTWEAVTASMYPDLAPKTVRLAFLRATVDKVTSTKELVAKSDKEEEQEEGADEKVE